jgi:PAS domain S-box-containing protein
MAEHNQEQLADDRLVPVGAQERELLADFLSRQAAAIAAAWAARRVAEAALPLVPGDPLPDDVEFQMPSLLALVEHVREGGHDMDLPAHAAWLRLWHRTATGRANIRDHFHGLRDVTVAALTDTDEIPAEAKGSLQLLLEAAVRNLRLETSEHENRYLVGEAVETRRRFEGLFETSADGIVIADLETGQVLAANRAAERLTARSRHELVGASLESIHPGLPAALAALLAAPAEGDMSVQALPVRRADGSRMVVEINAAPVDYGGRQAAQILARDVTERVRFRQELERRGEELEHQVAGQVTELERMGAFLENIINALPAELLVLDENLVVLHANSAYLARRRFSPGDVKGRHIREVFPVALMEGAGLGQHMLDTLQTGRRLRWSGYRQPTEDHSERIMDIGLDPCPGVEGQRYLLVTVEDVTERRRQLYERAILHRIAHEMLEMLSQRDLPRLLNLVLTAITAGGAVGLGFNRAFLLLVDPVHEVLSGTMGVGPEDAEDAGRVWGELSNRDTLEQFLAEYDHLPPPDQRPLHSTVLRLVFPTADTKMLPMLAAERRQAIHVMDAFADPHVPPLLREALNADEFVVAPMVVKDRIIGVAIADNSINRQRINRTDVALLTALANQAALAIDSAELREQAERRADEREEAYRKLEAMTERLVRSEALAAIGEVTAIVAHEIRNPLSTIGGFARMLLRRAQEPATVRRNAGIIAEEVAKLEQILSGLLDFSKPSRPRLRACSLYDIVDASLTAVGGRLEGAHVRVVREMAPDLPLVPVDCAQMEQVVSNLVINALDAMPDGGTVTVAARHDGDRVGLAVSDTGAGIPPQHVERIFDHFFTTKPTGTGLGLALAKKIVEDHGARLEVSSQEGAGSTFSITFVRDQSAAHAPSEVADAAKGPS